MTSSHHHTTSCWATKRVRCSSASSASSAPSAGSASSAASGRTRRGKGADRGTPTCTPTLVTERVPEITYNILYLNTQRKGMNMHESYVEKGWNRRSSQATPNDDVPMEPSCEKDSISLRINYGFHVWTVLAAETPTWSELRQVISGDVSSLSCIGCWCRKPCIPTEPPNHPKNTTKTY